MIWQLKFIKFQLSSILYQQYLLILIEFFDCYELQYSSLNKHKYNWGKQNVTQKCLYKWFYIMINKLKTEWETKYERSL